MTEFGFIHLHCHTEYSIVDGIISIESLIDSCLKLKIPAIAVTDQCNLFSMVKFYKAAMAAGIKPIIGAEVWVENLQNPKQPSSLVLLCQNQEGYRNITRIVSCAYVQGQATGKPVIKKSWLRQYQGEIIALSGGRHGDVGQALLNHNKSLAKQLLQEWLEIFPNCFYLELQRTKRPNEEEYIRAAVDLALEENVPVVATNDVRFLNPLDFEAHEARVCIQEGYVLEDSRRPHLYSSEQYLKPQKEMQQLFVDIPEALENSVQIAKRCNLELQLHKIFLPNFTVPKEFTLDNYFEKQAIDGLENRLSFFTDRQLDTFHEKKKIYIQRLNMELEVIKKMGYTGYFLIVADFISWAKQNKIPVGPGRGSGAGSLVAYSLKITDLDPIEHDLLFERFLNPERVSMPDFDIDFCMEGRDRVIDYVAEKYGRESVSQIITYGTMAARAVVRDVGRVLGYPYGFVDKLAKLIPFELGMTLKRALQQEEQLLKRYQEEEEIKTLINLALKLEGVTRNAGKHAGGVVIAPSILTDFTPLYCEPSDPHIVTQFDKDDVETIGLVKFDFLGLRTLTIIDWAVRDINKKKIEKGEDILDITQIPLDDPLTYELLKKCKTTAVFQLESRGMRDLIKRLQPNCFKDIVDLGALFRPGPLQSGMVDDFINRRHNRAPIDYLHPKLESVLKSTYGVILYQEQVMQIAQVLAGYTLGKADVLRHAMGKKKPEEMVKQRASFVDGAIERGMDGHTANYIFDLMEKFSGYGFNRSHSAAYALIAYQTAWLKAHYPAEFMAAVLSSDMDNTDKVVIFLEDCKNLGLTFVYPDINRSYYKFTVDNNQIVYGLGAIKGIGEAAIENIIEARKNSGKFESLFSFCHQVDLRKINRRVIESLIRSGAMDCFGIDRAVLMASMDKALQAAEQQSKNTKIGQEDLFSETLNIENDNSVYQYVETNPWDEETRLLAEKETLGLYLSGHPISRYEKELSHVITSRIVDLKTDRDQKIIVAGLVVSSKILMTKSGNRIAFLTLDDRTARIEVAVFSEAFSKYRDLIIKDQLIIVEGEISIDDFTGGYRITSQRIFNVSQMRNDFAKSLWLKISRMSINSLLIENLKKTIMPYQGGSCPVFINYQQDGVTTNIALGLEWKIRPEEKLLEELYHIYGRESVVVQYGR